jgi:hypothetical protein
MAVPAAVLFAPNLPRTTLQWPSVQSKTEDQNQLGGTLGPVVLAGSNIPSPSQSRKEGEGVIFDTSLSWDAHSRRTFCHHRYTASNI